MASTDLDLLTRLDARAASGDDDCAKAAAAIRRGARSGRKPVDDEDALVEIHELMKSGARSVEFTARCVVLTRYEPSSQPQSAVDRLSRKYRKRFKTWALQKSPGEINIKEDKRPSTTVYSQL